MAAPGWQAAVGGAIAPANGGRGAGAPVRGTIRLHMQTPASATSSGQSPQPTHPCVRCGAPVPLDVALCERCNPLGLTQPASTQAHGTILLAIVVSVAVLALLGRFALSGIGPFTGSVARVEAVPAGGLAITLSVRNNGASPGSTTCRVHDPSDTGMAVSAFLLSPQIPAGSTVAFSQQTTALGSTVRPLAVECTGP